MAVLLLHTSERVLGHRADTCMRAPHAQHYHEEQVTEIVERRLNAVLTRIRDCSDGFNASMEDIEAVFEESLS